MLMVNGLWVAAAGPLTNELRMALIMNYEEYAGLLSPTLEWDNRRPGRPVWTLDGWWSSAQVIPAYLMRTEGRKAGEMEAVVFRENPKTILRDRWGYPASRAAEEEFILGIQPEYHEYVKIMQMGQER